MSIVIPKREFGLKPASAGDLVEADRDAFRGAMRSLASGVSLITQGTGDEMTGMTATSVTSLAADPPTLIVCINRTASLYPTLAPGVAFGVNVLSADQQDIADRFAGRTGAKGRDRFVGSPWVVAPEGAPLLVGALAAFACEVDELVERHTHVIMIGRVKRLASRASGNALVYWRGGYDQLGWADDELARATGVTPS
jgi:flavin reductase (DIM6/NTAB) family NADH-FMN oxidoreductase RutF